MADILPALKKIAVASVRAQWNTADQQGSDNYNILQNNGRAAHQVVDHVHFHMIPKPEDAGDKEGLVIGWPGKRRRSLTDGVVQKDLSKDEISKIYEKIKSKL